MKARTLWIAVGVAVLALVGWRLALLRHAAAEPV